MTTFIITVKVILFLYCLLIHVVGLADRNLNSEEEANRRNIAIVGTLAVMAILLI